MDLKFFSPIRRCRFQLWFTWGSPVFHQWNMIYAWNWRGWCIRPTVKLIDKRRLSSYEPKWGRWRLCDPDVKTARAVTDTALGGVNRTGVIHIPYICALCAHIWRPTFPPFGSRQRPYSGSKVDIKRERELASSTQLLIHIYNADLIGRYTGVISLDI